MNALLSGQVHAIDQIPALLTHELLGQSGVQVLAAHDTALFNPITMQVDTAPMNDVRVDKAMRLIANRPQLIDKLARRLRAALQ